MDIREEPDLARLLDCYEVADADPQLLERIVAHAEAVKASERKAPASFAWMRNAAAIAAMAVLGFGLGYTSQQPVTYSAPAQAVAIQPSSPTNVNLDRIILGPQSFNEVML